jgi:predicted flavoprotein YhiN
VTREQRAALVGTLKALSFHVKAKRPIEEAIITRGGVSVKQIDPSTMQSKICSGLYFAGEMIDVDALTGGYNLQIAFSTGYLAGHSVD